MNQVWVYLSRKGNCVVFVGDHKGFLDARAQQDEDNRCTIEEIILNGYGEVGGSEEEGHFYADDGGDIMLYEVK